MTERPELASLRLAAPAKVNLGLRVLGRRPDGTHELESLFVPLDLADEIALELRPAPEVRVALQLELPADAAPVPADASNLAARAAAAFLRAAGLRREVRIHLNKRIPAAAGLGGGSSDAGAVLRGLDRCLPGALPEGSLAKLALELGADVPYFLKPGPAWVRGIGERIDPCGELPGLALLLVHPGPGASLSTARVFEAYDALGGPPRDGPESRAGPPDVRSLAALGARLANDLEPAAVRLCPPVGRLRRRLGALGALGVGMSGSGPTVYGLFADRGSAETARGRAGFAAPTWARVATTVQSQ